MTEIKFRAWDGNQRYMAYQGTPDLETLQSFMYHFGDVILMQFTGLHDKNGKEIYEGDLLHRHLNVYGEVVFSNSRWVAKFPSILWLDADQFIECEIIGNIYENPDLLESNG